MSGVELRELRMEPSVEYRRRDRIGWLVRCTLSLIVGPGAIAVLVGTRHATFALVFSTYLLWELHREARRFYRESTVSLDGDELQLRTPRSNTVFGRRAGGRVIVAHEEGSYFGLRYRDELRLFVDERGCLYPLQFEGSLWDLASLDRMCDTLAIPRVVDVDFGTPNHLARRYPVDPELRALLVPSRRRTVISFAASSLVVYAVLIGLVVALNLLLRL